MKCPALTPSALPPTPRPSGPGTATTTTTGIDNLETSSNLQSLTPRRHAAVMNTIIRVLGKARNLHKAGQRIGEVC